MLTAEPLECLVDVPAGGGGEIQFLLANADAIPKAETQEEVKPCNEGQTEEVGGKGSTKALSLDISHVVMCLVPMHRRLKLESNLMLTRKILGSRQCFPMLSLPLTPAIKHSRTLM